MSNEPEVSQAEAELIGLRADLSAADDEIGILQKQVGAQARDIEVLQTLSNQRYERLFEALFEQEPNEEDYFRMSWGAMFVEIRNRVNLAARDKERIAHYQRLEHESRSKLAEADLLPGESKAYKNISWGQEIEPVAAPGQIIVDLLDEGDKFTPPELGGTFRAEDPSLITVDPQTGVVPGTLTAEMIRNGIFDAQPQYRDGTVVVNQPKNVHLSAGETDPEATEKMRRRWAEDYEVSRKFGEGGITHPDDLADSPMVQPEFVRISSLTPQENTDAD